MDKELTSAELFDMFLMYEIANIPLPAALINTDWVQNKLAQYYAKRTTKKVIKYLELKNHNQQLKNNEPCTK